MKTLFIAIMTTSMLLTSTHALANNVTFIIDDIKSDKGKVYVQLFQGEKNYQANNAYLSSIAIAKKGQITITFNNLEDNDYGIRYFHDEDNNSAMETNLFGMPIEGYGYSNNAKANYGPVEYQAIKFQVVDIDVTNRSTINY